MLFVIRNVEILAKFKPIWTQFVITLSFFVLQKYWTTQNYEEYLLFHTILFFVWNIWNLTKFKPIWIHNWGVPENCHIFVIFWPIYIPDHSKWRGIPHLSLCTYYCLFKMLEIFQILLRSTKLDPKIIKIGPIKTAQIL